VPLDSTAELSNTPTSKWITVSIHAKTLVNKEHEEE